MMSILPSLALLACPIGMGLMMWFMGKGHRDKTSPNPQVESAPPPSLEHMREEQRRLEARISELETSAPDPSLR